MMSGKYSLNEGIDFCRQKKISIELSHRDAGNDGDRLRFLFPLGNDQSP